MIANVHLHSLLLLSGLRARFIVSSASTCQNKESSVSGTAPPTASLPADLFATSCKTLDISCKPERGHPKNELLLRNGGALETQTLTWAEGPHACACASMIMPPGGGLAARASEALACKHSACSNLSIAPPSSIESCWGWVGWATVTELEASLGLEGGGRGDGRGAVRAARSDTSLNTKPCTRWGSVYFSNAHKGSGFGEVDCLTPSHSQSL